MLTSTLPRWAGDAEPGFVLDLAREMGRDFDVELGTRFNTSMLGVSSNTVSIGLILGFRLMKLTFFTAQ